jgi:hypothetical protein
VQLDEEIEARCLRGTEEIRQSGHLRVAFGHPGKPGKRQQLIHIAQAPHEIARARQSNERDLRRREGGAQRAQCRRRTKHTTQVHRPKHPDALYIPGQQLFITHDALSPIGCGSR